MNADGSSTLLHQEDGRHDYDGAWRVFCSSVDNEKYLLTCHLDNWVYYKYQEGGVWGRLLRRRLIGTAIEKHPNPLVIEELLGIRRQLMDEFRQNKNWIDHGPKPA